MTQFPPNPHDGQQIVVPNDEGVCIYTFNAADNSWNYKVYAEAGNAHVTYTDQVLTRQDDVGLKLADPATLVTQKEVNYWQVEAARTAAAEYSNSVMMQADAAVFVRSSGIWVNQAPKEGEAAPQLQRFYLANDSDDEISYANATKAYVHQFGSGDLIDGGLEEVGDILQIYGPPRVDEVTPTHGVYRITSVERVGDGNGYDVFGLEFVRGYGAPRCDDQCVIKSGPDWSNTGGGDYLPLKGGSLSGQLLIGAGGNAFGIINQRGTSLLSAYTGQHSEDVQYWKQAKDYGQSKLEIVNRFLLEDYVANELAKLPEPAAPATPTTYPATQIKAGSESMVQPGYFYTSAREWKDLSWILIGFRGWADFTPLASPKNAWLKVSYAENGQLVHYQRIVKAEQQGNDKLKLTMGTDAADFAFTGQMVNSAQLFEIIGALSC